MKAVLFDFDYTLADSSEGIIDSVNTALRDMGLPPAPPAAIRHTIGLALPEMLKRLAGPEHHHRAPEFFDRFVARADIVMADATHLLPGVPETLRRLHATGLRLGIVSTKYRRRIEGVLRRDGLDSLIETIIGVEDVTATKPDPQPLHRALERLLLAPDEARYVGDSLTDAEASRRAAIPFIAVLTGTTDSTSFAREPCLATVASVANLSPELLRDGTARRAASG